MTDQAHETEDETLTGLGEIDGAEVVPAELPVAAGALAVRERGTAVVARDEISVADLVVQREKIQQVMQQVMKRDVHYGVIPGVKKPSLLKPGAEVLCVLFRLAPSYDSNLIWQDDGHLTVVAKARLTHIPTGLVVAEGEGLCSTREVKYAYRQGGRTCPSCGVVATIKRSKFRPKQGDYEGASSSDEPGWYCFAKIGGCGVNYPADDPAITEQQEIDRVPNPDLADTYNTVLKMGDKRALVGAILNGTAASDVFTQDVEDTRPHSGSESASAAQEAPATWETLQWGEQLHPDAPRGWPQVFEVLQWIDPGLDWSDLTRQAFAATFGGAATKKDLDDAQAQVAGRRLANAAAWLRDVAMGNQEFPPPTDEQIIEAFRLAFGVEVEVPQDDAGILAAIEDDGNAEDVPFGEETDAPAAD